MIASCDKCLVHLRKTELFETVIPSKIFEIMAMNVPIVMGVRGQAEQIVLAGQAGTAMTPENEDSLIEVLGTIAKNPTSYSSRARLRRPSFRSRCFGATNARRADPVGRRAACGSSATRAAASRIELQPWLKSCGDLLDHAWNRHIIPWWPSARYFQDRLTT